METIIASICENAHLAPWIIFGLLLLAGLNIPISEDILLLTGGMLAATCIPEETYRLYFWIYMGCWLSAWEAYWIGRLLGPKLYSIRLFKHIVTPARIDKLHHYYEKFGIFTFIVGRFIPGGVRNALFMTSGLGKMPFLTFIARDGLACLISSAIIFSIGYEFGENYQLIVHYVKRYELFVALAAIAVGLIILVILLKKRHRAINSPK